MIDRLAELGVILIGWLVVAAALGPLVGRWLKMRRLADEERERREAADDARRRAWPLMTDEQLEELRRELRRRRARADSRLTN